jgi:beta-N-acetylhexosaminidase
MEGALSQAGSLEEAALRAFNAGCDILCIAGGFERKAINEAPSFLKVHRYLVAAVKEGRISRAKLDASVQRILNLKKTYGLFSAPTLPVAINTSKHQALAAEVAKQSVQLIHNTLPADFSFANTLLIATKRVADDVALTQLAQNGASTFFYKELQPTPDEIAAAVSAAQSAGTIVVLTYNGWKFTQQIELIKALLPLNKPLIALVLGTPHDTKFLPSTSAAVASFGSSPASLDAALKLLHQFKNTEE